MRGVNYIFLFLILSGCIGRDSGKSKVILFHAGSLSLPLKQMERVYEERNPHIDIQLEGAGSVACARKITDLGRRCDIMASADYRVIDAMLIPEYTDINIRFASNSMVIAYSDRSVRAGEISADNWPEILLDENVVYGRSDPDSDPCGYRSLMTMKLADKYYDLNTISERLMAKDRNMIRPKEVDLVALLQTGVIDYLFIYKSVALQHNLKFVELPAEIDLSDPGYSEFYSTVSVNIRSNNPGEYIEMVGGEMIYGITLLKDAPAGADAINFLEFFLGSDGKAIIVSNGQEPMDPPLASDINSIPEQLHPFFKDNSVI